MAEKRRWLMLRGLGRESAHWGEFADRMKHTFPQDEVRALDLPGSGVRNREVVPSTVDGLMEAVRSQVPKSDGKLILFCMSLGSMVAIEWLRRYQEEVAAAILINSSVRGLSPLHRRMRWEAWPEFVQALFDGQERRREERVLRLVSRKAEEHMDMPLKWAAIANARPVHRLSVLRQLWAAAHFSPQPAPPSDIPVLLLTGLGDRLVDPSCSLAMAHEWGWDLAKHPWAGHELTLDDPQWVLDQVKSWFAKLGL